MALTYTPAGQIGFKLPLFTLPGVDGHEVDARELTTTARATLVAFICSHCPYVRAIEGRLIQLAAEFKYEGLVTLGICSNDSADHPEDAPPALYARWRDQKYNFPYAIDADQMTARAFDAVCTPDLFLFDAAQRLVYRGRLDDSWRDAKAVRRRELADAITAVLGGATTLPEAHPSMGCSIKWRA